MKFLFSLVVILVSTSAFANGWVEGTFKCRETTVEVTTVKLGEIKVPHMVVSYKGGSQSGFARIVEVQATHTDNLILGNINVPFSHGAVSTEWCANN